MHYHRNFRSAAVLAAGAGLGLSRYLSKQAHFRRKPIVLVTGGSRGLGLAIALEYARSGAKIVLCSRDQLELQISEKKFFPYHTDVMTQVCDLRNPDEIQALIDAIVARFGRIDILVNNAGVIEVAPLEALREDELRDVVEVNLWGLIRTTLRALPHMRPGSRIVNITSIGGEVAIPHLMAYTVSKFGALGFSLGLDAEVSKRHISVTTVVPGLMRTGSFVNALFKGDAEKEYRWFSLGSSLPFTSMSAESAAEKIVAASLRRKRFLVLSPQARVLRLFYHLAPGFALGLMRLVDRLMPKTRGSPSDQAEVGRLYRKPSHRNRGVRRHGHEAGDRLNENII